MRRFVLAFAVQLACLTGIASEARAIGGWGSVEQEASDRPQRGPGAPHAPLPPEGPYAPGESQEEPKEPNRIDDGQQPPIDAEKKRKEPDYDRYDEPTTAGDVALWVPRIILSPLYLVSEFFVRRPLGWLVTTAERKHWPAVLVDVFTFGPEKNSGVIPTGLIDFGFRPSIGLFFFHDELFAENNAFRLRAATGGTDWWMLQGIDRISLWQRHELYVSGNLSIRPDWVFHGLGPRSTDEEARFGQTRIDAEIGYEGDLWRSSSLETFVGFRKATFDAAKSCCMDDSLRTAIDEGRIAEPPGLEGYTVLRHGVEAHLDTRKERKRDRPKPGVDFVAPPGTGVELELRGEHAGGAVPRSGPPGPRSSQWVRYGATLGGHVDLTGLQRVVGLQLIADFADPITEGSEIPFTEQVSLGGDRPLRGFLQGRLRDRSAAAARFSYTWPIWVWLDGALHYSVGNVFGEHLDGFELDLLRSSFGLGLRSSTRRDHAFEVLFAAGTETFRDGGNIENFRFVFGATSGF